tara:strand:+ start:4969 stop:5205 length:237 start_codon:yes stop_codon:yes gene_type:complete
VSSTAKGGEGLTRIPDLSKPKSVLGIRNGKIPTRALSALTPGEIRKMTQNPGKKLWVQITGGNITEIPVEKIVQFDAI